MRLDRFCRVTHGGTPSKGNSSFWAGNIPWVSPKDMRSTAIEDAQDHISEEAVRDSATKLAPPGSILAVVRSGILARTAPIAVTSVRVAFNQDIKSIEPDPAKADVWFLYWMLKACEPVTLSDGVKKGATVHSIRSGFLESLEIPLPLLDEQRRIANAVGVQMAAVERARAAAEVQLEAAQSLEGAHLHSVFHGSAARGWTARSLGEVSHVISKGTTPTTLGLGFVDAGVPFLRAEDVVGGPIDPAGVVFHINPDTDSVLARSRLEPGDLLITIAGTLGRVGYIRDDAPPMNCNQAVALVRLRREVVDPRFVCYACRDRSTMAPLLKLGAGGAIQNLNLEQVRGLRVPIPSMTEQLALVSTLAKGLAEVDRGRRVAEAQLDAIRALPPVLLRWAFSGDL